MKVFVRVVLVSLVLLGILGMLIINPYNWFARKSALFSRERFELVHSGTQEQALVELLGEPLRIIEPPVPNQQCEGCVTYYFMGDPPDWLPGHQEAWVYVDEAGIVRGKVWNIEP